MSYYYDAALIPDEMRRRHDVYERIEALGIDLGSFEEDVTSLERGVYAGAVFHESGLVFLAGVPGGQLSMDEDTPELELTRKPTFCDVRHPKSREWRFQEVP